jgi:ABC-type transport system involved in multi-copper enzyme maturation permease subunit
MLSALIRRLSLPLLAKDLVETANRKRTYVLRVVYALLLYCAALLIYVEETNAFQKTTFELLGSGKQLMTITIALQCAGICLFMPALSVGAITNEKEKNTLTLLFLTRLGPWTILFEKYLARVVNMLSYLLISLPLLGIAYCMGGVTQLELWSGIWMLCVFAAQVGAISIACSAFFHSTAAAFIWTYLLGAGLYLVPIFLIEGVGYNQYTDGIAAAYETTLNGSAMPIHVAVTQTLGPALISLGYSPIEVGEFQTFRPITIHRDTDLGLLFMPLNIQGSTFWSSSPGGPAFWHVLVRSIPIGLTILIQMVLARRWLVSRAASTGGSRVMAILKGLDGLFHRLNQNRWTQGRVLVNDSEILPDEKPIAWRETRKRAFGTFRYLVRMLLLIEVPTLTVCLLFLSLSQYRNSYWNRSEVMIFMSIILWILSLLFLVSKAATVLPSERLRETFDVLLSTPLSTREIVQQKYAGVNRLIWVLSIPLVTVALTHAIWIEAKGNQWWGHDGVGWYLLGSLGAVFVLMRMVAWLSMLLGLAVKSQTKAIFATLAILVGWCVMPIVCLFIWDELLGVRLEWNSSLTHLAFAQSPAVWIAAVEVGEFRNGTGTIVICSLIEYGAIAIALREICLGAAAAMLGRPETPVLVSGQPRKRTARMSPRP